jgi:hypothetical protein
VTTRTTRTTIRFVRSFVLAGVEGEQPAGTYEIETDEELQAGLSFTVYRRLETRICLPWRTIGAVGKQTVTVDPQDLAAALARDSEAAAAAPV